MENTNKLICRKCGGNHITIKCGKEKIIQSIENKIDQPIEKEVNNSVEKYKSDDRKPYKSDDKKPYKSYNNDDRKKSNYEDKKKNNDDKKRYYRKNYSVKISDLPSNISERELMELTCDWGNILKIRVNNYDQNSTAYVDFEYEDQAKYFVESLDRTPFDSIIINVSRC